MLFSFAIVIFSYLWSSLLLAIQRALHFAWVLFQEHHILNLFRNPDFILQYFNIISADCLFIEGFHNAFQSERSIHFSGKSDLCFKRIMVCKTGSLCKLPPFIQRIEFDMSILFHLHISIDKSFFIIFIGAGSQRKKQPFCRNTRYTSWNVCVIAGKWCRA
mgnify:CR=1 FL=1